MTFITRTLLAMTLCLSLVPAMPALEPPAKAKVELRWLETKWIDGLTEDEGFQSSCDPKDKVNPHKKPAIVLTRAEVANAELI